MNEGLSNKLPLCIDLDDTLIRTDLSLESLIACIKKAPWQIFTLLFLLLTNKSRLKSWMVARAQPSSDVLPYREAVIEMIDAARGEGREVYLVTGSHEILARAIADHLDCFDGVMATCEERNLTGSRKADLLTERFPGGFEYVANGNVDIPIWKAAQAIVTVNAPASAKRAVEKMGVPHRHIDDRGFSLKTWLKAIRIHQWAKNGLLFVPLLTAQKLMDPSAVVATCLGFLAFGLCASSTYIINDLFDLDEDRKHKKKKLRPFAAGTIPVAHGVVASVLLMSAAMLIALTLPTYFIVVLGGYVISTLAYSFRLKRISSLDVVTLAALYTVRVIAGGVAAEVTISFWLLAFSMFIFLCLALVKRVAELVDLRERTRHLSGEAAKTPGRQYIVEDIPILQSLGAASGYLSVLVLALYINSPDVTLLYQSPVLIWLIAPIILLWTTRLWMVTARGYMNEDPVLFALKDPATWIAGAFAGAILAAAVFIELPAVV